MDILSGNKFRKNATVLKQDGFDSLQLGTLFPVNLDPVSGFNFTSNILRQ